MKYLIVSTVALLITIFSGEEAQAKRGDIWSTSEELSLVVQTEIQDDTGQILALCHLTKKTHILFAAIWRSSKAYVMAPNGCNSDSYYKLSAEKLEVGKALGDFPQDLPEQPVMSSAELISGFWGLGVIAALLALAGIKTASRVRRKSHRHAAMGPMQPVALQIMDAMCHAAKADGRLDASEIKMMVDIAKQMTGNTFDEDRIRRMFDMAEVKLTDVQFTAFGKGLSTEQKRMVMQASLMIVGADGTLDKDENIFVQKLARGLSINLDEVRSMLQTMAEKPT